MNKKLVTQGGQPGTVTLVKVETEGEGGANEIQNYLESFNKEIEGGGEVTRDGNTYFVDTSGQFYYSQRVVCVSQGMC